MGDIIDLPGKKPARSSLIAERLDPLHSPNTSKLDFTCVTCHNTTHFELKNAVFKQLELFCSKCGTGWKVSNPMFAANRARSN